MNRLSAIILLIAMLLALLGGIGITLDYMINSQPVDQEIIRHEIPDLQPGTIVPMIYFVPQTPSP